MGKQVVLPPSEGNDGTQCGALASAFASGFGLQVEPMLESMTDAFQLFSADWRFLFLNKKAEQILQRDRAELLGKVVWDEFPGSHDSIFGKRFREAMREQKAVSFEAFYDPLQKWGEMRVFPTGQGIAVYFTDETERRQRHDAMRLSEERFQMLAKATADAVWDWNAATRHTWWNEHVEQICGYPRDEIGNDMDWWAGLIHPDDREGVLERLHAIMSGSGGTWSDEYRIIRRDGTCILVLDRALLLRDEQGRVLRIVGSITDMSERRRTELERDRLLKEKLLLLESTGEGIWGVDKNGNCTFMNRAAGAMLGYEADEVLGRNMHELVHHTRVEGNPYPVDECPIALSARNGKPASASNEVLWRKDGTPIPVEYASYPVLDGEIVTGSVVTFRDISERKQAENEIRQLAFFDPLTRLPNRQLLMERLQRAVSRCERGVRGGALLFIDLDNFKSLNDTFGHDRGDLLLMQVAERLQACVNDSGTVGRLGGDEFLVVLEDLGTDCAAAAARAKGLAEAILASFRKPFQLDRQQYYGSPSIGAAVFTSPEDDIKELLRRADHAMYRAKEAGRNTLRFFDPAMQASMLARAALEADLKQAVTQGQLCLHFQPQVDLDGRVCGAEALVRWNHPTRGIVPPGEFIQLAEEAGLILSIGRWVLETACRQLALWATRAETEGLTLAVNVSAGQLGAAGFASHVLESVQAAGANPQRLKLELTESLLVENVDETIRKMTALKAAGIGFSLDDFGTGYSSLAYLKRLPLDQLKIDRSFVHDAGSDHNAAVIIRTIITLGQSLGLEVIAEGVETAEQRAFLERSGCCLFQGYYFGRPAPLEDFEQQLLARSASASR